MSRTELVRADPGVEVSDTDSAATMIALSNLMENNSPRLLSFARKLLRRTPGVYDIEPEDLIQSTVVRLLNRSQPLQIVDQQHFLALFFASMRHQAIDFSRVR
jgi:DNA-directed RNA polymerase specialized sigma24 family protein